MASFSPWASPDAPSEEEQEEALKEYGSKECLLFLIDCNSHMFQRNLDGIVPMGVALLVVNQWMQSRVIQHPKELFGVVFYNTKASKNRYGMKHVYTYMDLSTLSASIISDFQQMYSRVKEDPVGAFGNTPMGGSTLADNTNVFHDALNVCTQDLNSNSKIKSNHRCRIILMTCEDLPCGTDQHAREMILQKVDDMGSQGHGIEMYYMNRDVRFNPDKIFDEINKKNRRGQRNFSSNKKFDADESSLSKMLKLGSAEDAPDIVRERYHTKRVLSRINLEVGPDIKISLSIYRLFAAQKKPAAKKIVKETLKEMIRETRYLCADTCETLQQSQIKRFHVLGDKKEMSSRVFFEKEELDALKESHQMGPSARVLGFRPADSLAPYYHLKGSYFAYPDETRLHGSTKAFTAIHKAMTTRDVVGIVMLRTSKISQPRLSAMVPQECEYDQLQLLDFLQQSFQGSPGDFVEQGSASGTIVEPVPGASNQYRIKLDSKSDPFLSTAGACTVNDQEYELSFAGKVVPGKQIHPAGFSFVIFPWGDEIRKENEWMTQTVNDLPDGLVDEMENMVDKIYVPFSVGAVRNPSLNKFYAALKALALAEEIDFDGDDFQRPEGMDEEVEEHVHKILDLLPDIKLPTKKTAAKRKASSSKDKKKSTKAAKNEVGKKEAQL